MAIKFSSDKNPGTSSYKKKQAPDLQAQVYELQSRLDRMALTMTAMWEVLTKETEITEEQLMEKINDLDIDDGVMDGKIDPEQRVCKQCGKPIKRRQLRCGYCETFSPIERPFDALW